jgi:hypothetical protein
MIISPSGGDDGPPSAARPGGLVPILLIVAPIVLLMSFSVAAILLDQATLAVMAGTAGVGLAGEAGRRALRPPGGDPPSTEVDSTVR